LGPLIKSQLLYQLSYTPSPKAIAAARSTGAGEEGRVTNRAGPVQSIFKGPVEVCAAFARASLLAKLARAEQASLDAGRIRRLRKAVLFVKRALDGDNVWRLVTLQPAALPQACPCRS
jgi:hypothetical protein